MSLRHYKEIIFIIKQSRLVDNSKTGPIGSVFRCRSKTEPYSASGRKSSIQIPDLSLLYLKKRTIYPHWSRFQISVILICVKSLLQFAGVLSWKCKLHCDFFSLLVFFFLDAAWPQLCGRVPQRGCPLNATWSMSKAGWNTQKINSQKLLHAMRSYSEMKRILFKHVSTNVDPQLHKSHLVRIKDEVLLRQGAVSEEIPN
jgi:hypothetical protein